MKSTFSIISTAVLISASLWMAGCGTSSTGTNNSVVSTYGANYTSCTTPGNGVTQTCIPGLGNNGTVVEFNGPVAISNGGTAKNFIRGYPQFYNLSIDNGSNALRNAILDILLVATGNGPQITLTITFPGLGGMPLSGYATFVASNSSNPNVGTISLATGSAYNTSLSVISMQPWDGSIPYMTAATVMMDGQNVGTAGLRRVQ